ncbi:MAG: 16S rRNA (uracil(1498)-N(3))-methyltransferase [Acidobacteria bacterium]|nr:16S rRNA (uracil(1498)-N(3))-methyltransferase [Acidobacteriota bacterium]
MRKRDGAPARPPRVLVPDLAEHLARPEEHQKISLKVEEREHVRSRRLRDGDEVVAVDGKGARAGAVLVGGGTAIALLPSKKIFSSSSSSSSSPLPGEPANRVVVALACAEPARIEWAIEKGTECGAAGFVLLDAERSQRAHVAALAKRIPRLVRIAEEATKQCDRTLVPFVEGPRSTGDFLGRVRGERVLVADAGGAALSGPFDGAAIVAIGPEGGFAPPEISLFEENSSLFFSLGPRILRLETAVVVALARLVDRD